MSHHRIAGITVAAALALDVLLGWAFAAVQHVPVWLGVYCALANAVTVGGTVPPSVPWGYGLTAAECALVVPLFAATFSLFTSGLAGLHVTRSEARLKEHVAAALTAHHSRLLAIVAAKPQVRAGSTPFDSRERPDGPAAAPVSRKLQRPGGGM